MKDYYNSCKALVWPSFTESLGMPLIEASVYEKDILASDLEYVHDILEIKKKIVLILMILYLLLIVWKITYLDILRATRIIK